MQTSTYSNWYRYKNNFWKLSGWAELERKRLTPFRVLHNEVLIIKFVSINTFATSSISSSKIPSLNHKARNDTMEFRTFVAKPFFASAKAAKIFWKQQ